MPWVLFNTCCILSLYNASFFNIWIRLNLFSHMEDSALKSRRLWLSLSFLCCSFSSCNIICMQNSIALSWCHRAIIISHSFHRSNSSKTLPGKSLLILSIQVALFLLLSVPPRNTCIIVLSIIRMIYYNGKIVIYIWINCKEINSFPWTHW